MRFHRVLKIRHLLLIRTLGTELNLRRCAEILHTSAPAISRTLAEIEEQLGEKLFERTTRSIVPTPPGQSLIWHAQRVLADLEQAEADFDALARGASQVLHIGVLSGFDPGLLARALALFVQQRPDIEVRLHEGLAADLFLSLRQDRVNLILSHVDVPHEDADIVAETVYEESIAVIASPAHPLAADGRSRSMALGAAAGRHHHTHCRGARAAAGHGTVRAAHRGKHRPALHGGPAAMLHDGRRGATGRGPLARSGLRYRHTAAGQAADMARLHRPQALARGLRGAKRLCRLSALAATIAVKTGAPDPGASAIDLHRAQQAGKWSDGKPSTHA